MRTFLERDLPQFGIRAGAAAMRRFWTMLAHVHGQPWNASELGRAALAPGVEVMGIETFFTAAPR